MKTFAFFTELVLLLLTLTFVCAHEDANAIRARNADSPASAGRWLKVREEDRRPLPPGPLLGRSPDSPIHNHIPAEDHESANPRTNIPQTRKARSPTPQDVNIKYPTYDEGPDPRSLLNDRDVPPSHALNVDRDTIAVENKRGQPEPDEFEPPQGLCGGGPFLPTCEEMFGSAPPGLGANLKIAALAMMAVLVAGGVLL
jgi:hypothetical protein